MDIPKNNKRADLVYKSTKARELMLTFIPPEVKKYERAPVYFIIPGGGWQVEKREDMLAFSARSSKKLGLEGFATVAIDYRTSPEGVVMKDIICDCFDAARHISHFSDILEIDRDSFVFSGHSAGGHLALMLSYAPQENFEDGYEFCDKFTPKAAAPMSPPTILYDNNTHNLRDIGVNFAGCDTRKMREYTSPITYAGKNSCPTLLAAGTSDYLVFASSSERLYDKLTKEKAKCVLVLSVGGGHCFEKINRGVTPSISFDEIQDIISEFILKQF